MPKISIANRTLSLFDNLQTDRSLKKYAVTDKVNSGTEAIVMSSGFDGRISYVTTVSNTNPTSNLWMWNSVANPTQESRKSEGWLSRIRSLLSFKPHKQHAAKVFTMFRASSEEMSVMKIKAEKIREAIAAARTTHQTALAEKIEQESKNVLIEERMILGGVKRRITESQIVDIFEKCDVRPLSLTYIANYVNPIPPEVVEKLHAAEDMCVFDNYVILHFDPLGEGERLTRAEEERRRDPILFGLVSGVRKLYFIADWVDETCDLTFDKLIEKMGITADETVLKTGAK